MCEGARLLSCTDHTKKASRRLPNQRFGSCLLDVDARSATWASINSVATHPPESHDASPPSIRETEQAHRSQHQLSLLPHTPRPSIVHRWPLAQPRMSKSVSAPPPTMVDITGYRSSSWQYSSRSDTGHDGVIRRLHTPPPPRERASSSGHRSTTAPSVQIACVPETLVEMSS